jgi:transaldolase
MKLFLDTAHVPTIRHYAEMGIIDGVTTNPTHLSKEGKSPTKTIKEICKILPEGDISVEVTQKKPRDVYKQALEIVRIAPNITVKVPCHQDYYEVIKKLVDHDVPVNITLLFTLIQGLYMAKLRVKYISPFVGRLDDIGEDGISLIADLRDMVDLYGYTTQILAASIRSVEHLHECIELGAHVATIPVDVLEKSLTHPLTDKGMKLFDTDWAKLKVKKFP